jgi:hypothetical protein
MTMTRSKLPLLAVCFALSLLLATAFPIRISHAQYGQIDPEGESQVAYSLSYAGGDPIDGATHAVYVMDDGSVLMTVDGEANSTDARRYRLDADIDTNTYTTALVSASTLPALPDGFGASVAIYTVHRSSGLDQVRTINKLSWRVVGGTVGYLCWGDSYAAFASGATGGLSWNIQQSPQDPPYTTSPTNANLFNDTGNGKYKNFNYLDPNLSTVAVHFARIEVRASDPAGVYRYQAKHKMKNEAKGHFRGEVERNQNLCSF